jgi:hypothetical protein
MRYVLGIIGSTILVSVAIFTIMTMQDQPVPSTTGWCCLKVGNACQPGFDALLCRDSDGLIFSASENQCSTSCKSYPPDAVLAVTR